MYVDGDVDLRMGKQTEQNKDECLSEACEFLYYFLSARKIEDREWDVIQNLPIKCCPGACISNGANLGIFKERSVAAALVQVGEKLPTVPIMWIKRVSGRVRAAMTNSS